MCCDSWWQLSEMAAGMQSALRRIMLCLMMGELVWRWDERGSLLKVVDMKKRAGNGLCQKQGEASCCERMKTGPVIWLYGSMKKVIALKFYISRFIQSLVMESRHGESPSLKVVTSSRPKQQMGHHCRWAAVMLATVIGRSSSKESLEDGLRVLVRHTEPEPMSRHSEGRRLSFGLGQKGAYGWIWVISMRSLSCVYRPASPERRCPLQRQEGRWSRTEPFGAHRKLEKNKSMLFSCSSMWFVDNKSLL